MSNSEECVVRYFSFDKLIRFLEDEAIWFSRARQWVEMDPQETQILPVIETYLLKEYGYDLRRPFFLAKAEFELGLAFACSFSAWDGSTSEHMWEEFAVNSTEPGAAVVFPMSLVHGAGDIKARLLSGNFHMNSVTYLESAEFHDGVFFDNPNELDGGMFTGSLWFKSNTFRAERERRAIILSRSHFDIFLKRFCAQEGIPIQRGGATRKEGEIAIAFGYGDQVHHNFGVALTGKQLEKMRDVIKRNDYEVENWELPNHGRNTKGINVPVNFRYLKEIILAPNLRSDRKCMRQVMELAEKSGVTDRIREIDSS